MSTTELKHMAVSKQQRVCGKYICLRMSILLVSFLSIATVYFLLISRSFKQQTSNPPSLPVSSFSKLVESVQPEERDVFQDFRTSFLPQELVIVPHANTERTKRHVIETNLSRRVWLGKPVLIPKRTKRTESNSVVAERGSLRNGLALTGQEETEEVADESSQLQETGQSEDYEEYDDDDDVVSASLSKESIGGSGRQEDPGPLDDVVEQVRAQPELEEGELGTAPLQYRLPERYTGIHAFWKGQGDTETIRHTQARIMRQYMDVDADPCEDFFQYACGNWPTLNPIPADKAGYDTFEMLRENLDTVLKDLLEFKTGEHYPTEYPGPHLDLYENFLLNPKEMSYNDTRRPQPRDENLDFKYDGIKNSTFRVERSAPSSKTDILSRIREYVGNNVISAKTQLPTSQNTSTMKNKYSHKKRHFLQTEYVKENIIDKDRVVYRRLGRKLRYHKKKTKRESTIIVDETKKILIKPEHPKQVTNEKDNDPAKGDATVKARFLFRSCMNYEILHKRGHRPLLDLLDLLGGWPLLKENWDPKNFDWLELMAKLRLYNNDILISEWVGPDIKNSDEFVIQFDQTSLGLPTRDYFLQASNKAYLEAYKEYLIKIVLLLGGDPDRVEKEASDLILFETRLANITSAPEERRNVSELYRRMPLKRLETTVPGVQWHRYLCIVLNRTVNKEETVVLFAMKYVQSLVILINETQPNILSNYLLWRFVRHRVNNLDDRFQDAKQRFYNILFGREQAPPRWKNCISQVNSNMGMALGAMFVRKYFDENSKNDTLSMTREIQKSFRELLQITDWIDSDTKRLAAHKVDAMMLRIGYPDFILKKAELDERYKEVRIYPDRYFENILNILQHLTKMEQARLGQPVNKTLWNTAPAVVNAYYSRNKNQIMFPAGILQPPFYHRHFPKSLNYGGIGVVIGHEITHGFDDKGRLFDSDGNLHRWWSDSAVESFHLRAQCLIDQYAKYVVPGVNMKLDGVNTQGENIADNGGVKQAFRAYRRWLNENDVPVASETMPGLNHTHTQLFFLNFAQVWCGSMRPEAMRNKLKTAVHSPGRFRVIGALSNTEDFAREFSCPVGSPMNPVVKCSVW